jgi:hypothetical protein
LFNIGENCSLVKNQELIIFSYNNRLFYQGNPSLKSIYMQKNGSNLVVCAIVALVFLSRLEVIVFFSLFVVFFSHNKVVCKVRRLQGEKTASFSIIGHQMCKGPFNAQGLRLTIVVVQVGAVKIYVSECLEK